MSQGGSTNLTMEQLLAQLKTAFQNSEANMIKKLQEEFQNQHSSLEQTILKGLDNGFQNLSLNIVQPHLNELTKGQLGMAQEMNNLRQSQLDIAKEMNNLRKSQLEEVNDMTTLNDTFKFQHPREVFQNTLVPTVSLSDVAGYEREKKALDNFIANAIARSLTVTKAVVLAGPPGVGKTQLLKAVAGDRHMEVIVARAQRLTPDNIHTGFAHSNFRSNHAILLIQSLEKLGANVLDELWTAINLATKVIPVVTMCTTGRHDISQYTRKKFEWIIIPLPDMRTRQQIAELKLKQLSIGAPTTITTAVAQISAGMSGADVEWIIGQGVKKSKTASSHFMLDPKSFEDATEELLSGLTST